MKVLLSLGLFAISLIASAQDGQVRRGDKYFGDFSYVDAISSYESAALKGAGNAAVASKLAMSYWKIRDLNKAELWYAKAVSSENATSDDLYHYSEVLRSNGRYAEADTWLEKYNMAVGDDSRVALQKGSAIYAPKLQTASLDKVTVSAFNSNSGNSDMSPTILGDKLYFASARSMEVNARRRHTWNNKPFLDIYECAVGEDGQVTSLIAVEGVNTTYHESNAAFTADGKTMYFTRNNFHKGKKQLTTDKVNNLKMFSRTLTADGWSNEKNFPFNSNDHSVGHPTLTADGLTLFFASDMPGGQGGTDIWMCTKEGDSWSKPSNLGATVNTRGNEMFPFIHPDGIMFFSSDGHQGLGGLDILYTNLAKGNAGAVRNPGAPINSGYDDFSLVLNAASTRGYFASNRTGGKGDDDIYLFDLSAPFGSQQLLAGTTKNLITGEIIPDLEVNLMDDEGNVLGTTTSDASGNYAFSLDPENMYDLDVTSTEYAPAKIDPFASFDASVDTTLKRDILLIPDGEVWLVYNVLDGRVNRPLEGVNIVRSSLIQYDGVKSELKANTDKGGSFREALDGVNLGDSVAFFVELEKEGFYPKKGLFKYSVDEYGEVDIHGYMDMCLFPIDPDEHILACSHGLDRTGLMIDVGRDLNDMIDIDPIYFDLNKFDIRSDAAKELQKIVSVLKDNPSMHIELGSHTDSRGSDVYNETLSDKRARSSVAWIIEQGISADRITGKGYGESKLVNGCKNGVKCSKADHQANRRTEFIIVKM